jgi:OOP family OmpA-OmpF porin
MNSNGKLDFFLMAVIVLYARGAFAQDVIGSKDHPLVSRYPGSVITRYQTREYDEYLIPLAGVPRQGLQLEKTKHLEGKLTRIRYAVPPVPNPRSTLEVYRNYESALMKAGFESLFSCVNPQCGDMAWQLYHAPFEITSQRFLAARQARPEGDVYITLYVMDHTISRGSLFVALDIIEMRPMESGLITLNAEAMAKEIAASGRVALYGIYFDFNKAEIKPESEPTLNQIGKLLKQQPALKLLVTGHTDNLGTMTYNLELSQRRAEAIVNSLVSRYGIEQRRLTPQGLGFQSPIASNKTEEGRAKNRRVELVEQ